MEPWRAYSPVFADSHHFDEEQDSDPHSGEKLDPNPHLSDAGPQPWKQMYRL